MIIFPHDPDNWLFPRRSGLRSYHFRQRQHPAIGALVAAAVIAAVVMVAIWLGM